MTQLPAGTATAENRSTRDRILDTAERLLGKHGPDATSLREITSAAGVNLAAVNYHFQSKDALVRAVLDRRIEPMVRRRLQMLDDAEKAAGDGPVAIERLVEAFVMPVLEFQHVAPDFMPLMARMYTEPRFLEEIIARHMETLGRRFLAAFYRTLPGLSHEGVIWRVQFAVGALMHVMLGPGIIRTISEGHCDPSQSDTVARQIITFLVAGFTATAPKEDERCED